MLIINDEKVLLLNRIAPVIPYTGAFIAMNEWDYKKSIFYIVLGASIKFTLLISLCGTFYILFEREIAQNATLVLIFITIAISFIYSYIKKKSLTRSFK
jgi:hypothetical protein